MKKKEKYLKEILMIHQEKMANYRRKNKKLRNKNKQLNQLNLF